MTMQPPESLLRQNATWPSPIWCMLAMPGRSRNTVMFTRPIHPRMVASLDRKCLGAKMPVRRDIWLANGMLWEADCTDFTLCKSYGRPPVSFIGGSGRPLRELAPYGRNNLAKRLLDPSLVKADLCDPVNVRELFYAFLQQNYRAAEAEPRRTIAQPSHKGFKGPRARILVVIE
jgi:hypothetical protein